MTYKVTIEEPDNYKKNAYKKKPEIYKTEEQQPIAQFAMALVERWGMIAASPDGEDSAGRSKLVLSTPTQVVKRACETAELMFQEIRERGWMLDIPDYAEINKDPQTELLGDR